MKPLTKCDVRQFILQSMLSFSTPLKTATLQNLDRFLLRSEILSVTKVNEHTPLS